MSETVYPGAIDTYDGADQPDTPARSASMRQAIEATIAIETALGTNPQGVESTVGARIAALEVAIVGGHLEVETIDVPTDAQEKDFFLTKMPIAFSGIHTLAEQFHIDDVQNSDFSNGGFEFDGVNHYLSIPSGVFKIDANEFITKLLDNASGQIVIYNGDLYVSNYGTETIRKINLTSLVSSIIAGTSGVPGYTGDGGLATAALISTPLGIGVDTSGVDPLLIFSDFGNNVVRQINLTTGIISTIAGTGTPGYSGDGAAAIAAELNGPSGLSVRPNGDYYLADFNNQVIRKVTKSTGFISTDSVGFGFVTSVDFDAAGNYYVCSGGGGDFIIRKVDTSNVVTAFAGDGTPNHFIPRESYPIAPLTDGMFVRSLRVIGNDLYLFDSQYGLTRLDLIGYLLYIFYDFSGSYPIGSIANPKYDNGPFIYDATYYAGIVAATQSGAFGSIFAKQVLGKNLKVFNSVFKKSVNKVIVAYTTLEP